MSCTFFFRSSRTFLKKHEILFSEAATQLSTQKICSKVAAHTLCEDFHSLSGVMKNVFNHSHKKRKDSLEGSLDRVLLAAELEFPKILVPRLPQHTSDVNIECAGKSEWSKQQCSLHVTSFLEH